MDLTALPETDDVAYDGEEKYRDQLPPRPPATGNYELRISQWGLKTIFGSDPPEFDLVDGKYPTIVVTGIQLVDSKRMFFLSTKFSLKPGANRKGASRGTDLLRAHNEDRTWKSSGDLIQQLEEEIESGATFKAKLTWIAKDSDYFLEKVAEFGDNFAEYSDDEQRELAKWQVRGEKNFPKDENGSPIPLWEGPSGEEFPAKPEITTLYSSGKDNVTLVEEN